MKASKNIPVRIGRILKSNFLLSFASRADLSSAISYLPSSTPEAVLSSAIFSDMVKIVDPSCCLVLAGSNFERTGIWSKDPLLTHSVFRRAPDELHIYDFFPACISPTNYPVRYPRYEKGPTPPKNQPSWNLGRCPLLTASRAKSSAVLWVNQ